MADEKESAPRARPFTPPLPPYRGAATVARPPINVLTPPEVRRGALFIGTRAPSKPVESASAAIADIAEFAPQAQPSAPDAALTAREPRQALLDTEAAADAAPQAAAGSAPSETESPRAEAIAATEAMPWLFADPRTADRRPTPAAPMAVMSNSVAHAAASAPQAVAELLESLALRVRAGDIDVASLDPSIGEAATLAGVLAVLLRHRPG